ncbi:cytochrome c biogenesis protein CcdA [Rhizobiales bacterium]|uniref:cytochrome c biogenesis CcdA family protein n=1 Tax=Hongsoonwoonella zoysiae TaxID=2821844 RepID=UPI00156115D5|nr:cytochrome c biogenesis CcdA family protein [Hongsoonwoonella zoysiae]NRG18740.1 cytochrome c biogenesis protein CcdA [Hongsoonwoonella zoysiae]
MLSEVTVLGAFVAGIISFVSPCVLPLVPPYLGFLAGVSLDELTGEGEEKADARRVFLTALLFVLGFSTVFVSLGASASLIGQFVTQHVQTLAYVAGAIIIVMGLHFLGIFKIGLFYREARFQVEKKPAGLIGAYVIGLAFAFGWTPCVGPILAAILFIAGSEDTVLRGATLLGAYSLGLGVPFLAAALFAGPFMKFMGRFKRHMMTVERAMGVLLIITGVAFMTGQMAALSYWLLEAFPQFAAVG